MSEHSTHMKYFSTQEGKFYISIQKGLLYCINTNEIPNHFSMVKGTIYHVANSNCDLFMCEVNMLFSHVLRYCSFDIIIWLYN